jgi:hypothetical protein
MKRTLLAAVTALIAVAGLATLVLSHHARSHHAALAERHAIVAERGSTVMPFDQDASRHYFKPTPDGGTQVVLANDPKAAKQIKLIREHLAREAKRFAKGDFRDPAVIHGMDMPGLTILEAHASKLRVTYTDERGGGTITYTASEPALVNAIHRWFAAQVRDHGAAASAGDPPAGDNGHMGGLDHEAHMREMMGQAE